MLNTDFCGIKLKNPTVLASGVLGVTRSSLSNCIRHGAGAVTIKSISKEPRTGHKSPIILTYEAGMINAVGYSNPGIIEAKKEFRVMRELDAPAFASIIGTEAEDFSYMAKNLIGKDNEAGFSAVEIPLSCPHTPGYGMLAGQGTPEATKAITTAVKKEVRIPVIVKISPSIPNIAEVAKAAEQAGADAINMGNTLGPGMLINIDAKKPMLDFGVGGLSGPAIRPVAVRCVYDLYRSVKIPIIGTGGITTWRDAVEMMMAGASLVGLGSAVYYDSIAVFRNISRGMERFMKKKGYKNVSELVGAAHDP